MKLRSLTVYVSLFSLTFFTSCGNEWISSSERKNSPSALIAQAEYEYDKGQYASAMKNYDAALKIDDSNVRGRIGYVFAVLGATGKNVLGLVQGFSSSTNSGLVKVIEVVGLRGEDIALVTLQEKISVAKFRKKIKRLNYTNQAWERLCLLLPRKILESAYGSTNNKSAELKVLYSSKKCNNGQAPGTRVKSSAIFGATMTVLTEAVGIYQALLDPDAAGNPQINAKISSIDTSLAAASTHNSNGNFAEALSEINKATAALAEISNLVSGEMMLLMKQHFAILPELISSLIPGENAGADKIVSAIKKASSDFFEIEGRVQSQANAANVATKASSANSYFNTAAGGADDSQANKENIEQICQNYETLKMQYPTISKPTSCP